MSEDQRIEPPRELPRELTRSDLPWKEPHDITENRKRRALTDRFDEMAVRADFASTNPSIDTIRKRAVYRPELDYHCLPRGQRFVVITTFGPTHEYDVQSSKIKVVIWGVFSTLAGCANHIRLIRAENPHAVFVPVHVVQLGGPIDMVPPNDGDNETFHLNTEHHEIMKNHLSKCVKEAEFVDNNVRNAVRGTREKNRSVQKFNKKMVEVLREIKGNLDAPERDQKKKQLFDKFSEYRPSEDNQAVRPGNRSIEEQARDCKSLPFELVEDHIECIEKAAATLPENYVVHFKRYTTPEGKVAIVRVVSRRKKSAKTE